MALVDIHGNPYEPGRCYVLPAPVAPDQRRPKEGKSEPRLRELFGLERAPKSARERWDAQSSDGGARFETKDFTKTSASVRGGAEAREAVGEIYESLSELIKLFIGLAEEDRTADALRSFLRETRRGSFKRSRIEQFISVMEALDARGGIPEEELEALEPFDNMFFPDPRSGVRKMLNMLTGPRVFDVDYILVVAAEQKLVVLTPDMFSMLVPIRVSQNLVSYEMSPELRDIFDAVP